MSRIFFYSLVICVIAKNPLWPFVDAELAWVEVDLCLSS